MSKLARELILSKLTQSAQVDVSAADIQQQAAELLLGDALPLHAPLLSRDAVQAFIARIEQGKVIGTSCSSVATITDLPAVVMKYLLAKGLPLEVSVQNIELFDSLPWQELSNLGPTVDGQADKPVVVSFADAAIAETGSVVFHSGEHNPVLLNFLGLYQVIVIAKSSIVPLLEDYAKNVDCANTPRNTIWITGASGTTDIEGVLVQGAHGPCEVHIVIIDDM